MGYQPTTAIIIIYNNGNKSINYKGLSFFERLKAKSIYNKYKCNVFLVTNHINTIRYLLGTTSTGEVLYQTI